MSSVIVVKRGYRRAVIAAGMRGAPGAGGGGSAGVSSFNTRTGPVTLVSADVSGALGFTPANSADLADVALSGAYADLLGLPAIPAAPADIGAATAAQGDKADTAVQPAALTSGLAGKVDKDGAKVLSDQNYTAAEKAKLAGLEAAHFKGLHASLAALQSAHPSAVAGDYADVDSGTGADVARYIWDVSDSKWVIQSGASGSMTAAQIKTAYESNPDTNAFSDAEQAKLGAIAADATANATNAELRDRSTHTGTQAASTISDLAAAVRGVVMTGVSFATATAGQATDSLLVFLGKLQAQINGLATAVAGKQAELVSGTNIKTVNGTSLIGSGNLVIAGGGVSLPAIRSITGDEALGLASINTFGVNATTTNYTSTIPAQAAVAWTADAELHFLTSSTGDLAITAGAGVSLNGVVGGSLTLSTQNGAATLKRIGADSWWLGGVIGTAADQRTALQLGSAATRSALGASGPLYSRDSILGAVAQAAGVPTGAIIERGLNANGEYVRFADRTQICIFELNEAAYDISTAYLGGFRGGGVIWIYPAPFAAKPAVKATPEILSGFGCGLGTQSATQAVVFWFSVTSQGASARKAALVAIGSW